MDDTPYFVLGGLLTVLTGLLISLSFLYGYQITYQGLCDNSCKTVYNSSYSELSNNRNICICKNNKILNINRNGLYK